MRRRRKPPYVRKPLSFPPQVYDNTHRFHSYWFAEFDHFSPALRAAMNTYPSSIEQVSMLLMAGCPEQAIIAALQKEGIK